MKNIEIVKNVQVTAIQVPDKYRRRGNAVEDDKLRLSIQRTGVQQPLVVSNIGNDKFVLIDGYRRLEVAKHLRIHEVPCVIDEVPDGVSAEEYRDRMRFILDEHRQDLFPSQRATLIKTLMKNFKMNRKQVGEYLGVDPTTIGNWLIVDSFVPEVAAAIDNEEITQHAARAFVGMTSAGQKHVWELHKEDFKKVPPAKLHKQIREEYHPSAHPTFYQKPEAVIRKLNRGPRKRVSARRPIVTKSEKEILFSDIEVREAELRDAKKDLEKIKVEIALATRVIRSVVQNDRLFNLVPEDIKMEFRRFAEIYI